MDRIRVSLIEYTRGGEELVAGAARLTLSRKPVEALFSMGKGEVEEWIRELIRRGHGSPLEHSSYTFLVEGCSRVCSHQLVRHRLASYSQQSMRYSEGYLRDAALKASQQLGLACPERPGRGPEARVAYECYSRALAGAAEAAGRGEEWAVEAARLAFVFPPGIPSLEAYAASLLRSASEYYSLLARGARREDARYLIPSAVRTRIVATMNARELLESFLPLRMCVRAQWEIRRVAWLLWRELARVHPAIFKYAGPRCVYMENRARGSPAPLEDYLEGRAEFTIPYCPEQVPRKAIPACLRAARDTAELRAGARAGIPRSQSH
ncbi:FAD-dependent thymidylate synthase [Stetteria hydrogenophila]